MYAKIGTPLYDIHPLHGHYTLGRSLAFIIAVVAVALVWGATNRFTKWDDHREMFIEQNTGLTNKRSLTIIAIGYGVAPSIAFAPDNWWENPLWTLIDAVWVCAMLLVAALVTNVVVKRITGTRSMRRNSAQVGLVLGVLYIAYGYILGATLPGPGDDLGLTFQTSIGFGLLATTSVTVIFWALTKVRIFRNLTAAVESTDHDGHKANLAELIANGNWAATILASAAALVLGMVTASAVSGPFEGWANGIVTFVVAQIIMFVVAVAGLSAVDRFIITTDTIKSVIEKNKPLPATVLASFVVTIGTLSSYLVS